ncbi:MAG TPA: TauD/TfdA family dioxygenase [Bordetella sp.]
MEITESGATLGARIKGLDLGRPLSDAQRRAIEQALGRHGVVSFPNQTLTARNLRDFAENFGTLEINVANLYHEPDLPEVMILSNLVENGKPIGLSDAGQDWHTDMSYSETIAFSNVLYGLRIPVRGGQPLGNTEFCNMHAAYEELPRELKDELDGMTITHDFNKFWEMMRREKGSTRAPLTEAQRRRKPPVSHPVFLTHPITGRKVLYANPGYSMRINELSPARSEQVLAFLFEHQLQEKYRYRHRWTQGDVLMWDNMGTIHNAVADYRPDEPRLIKRCQVMADRYFPQ